MYRGRGFKHPPKQNQRMIKEKEEEDDSLKMATKESNKFINDFFNMTLYGNEPSSTRPKISHFEVAPIPQNKAIIEPIKRNFSGTQYTQQYQQEFNYKVKQVDESSSFNLSQISGPSYVTETFIEDDEDDLIHKGNPSYFDHRKSLPIYQFRNQIIENSREHPVMIISGCTGCGKSTQVPQYIYEECMKRGEQCNILIAQPRKIAAITIAQRVASERNVELGNEVGYQVALNKVVGRESDEVKTIITYCTTGVILAKLIMSKSMSAFTHIILDEIHERSVDTDLLIAIIRRFLINISPQTRIILMSATMNVEQYSRFFTVTNDGESIVPPLIQLGETQRRHRLDINYLEDVEHLLKFRKTDVIDYKSPGIKEQMYEIAVQLISLILQPLLSKGRAYTSILVFLPGINEIEELHKRLTAEMKGVITQGLDLFILHSMLATEDQKKAFSTNVSSKVILSTNIAESSVTIPKITHVIDFCLTKYQGSVSGSRMCTLITDWATKNNCTQRAGRAGRVAHGVVYRLISREFFNRYMRQFPKPEIQCIPLETVVLKIKKLNMESPCELLAASIDPPDISQIVDAILTLKEVGGLLLYNKKDIFEFENGDISFLGEVMAALPCDVKISRLIMMGYLFSVLEETIIIGAGLTIQGLFLWTLGSKINNFNVKEKWAEESESDLIAILNVYRTWKNLSDSKYFNTNYLESQWCRKSGVDLKNLNEMRLWIADIEKRLFHLNIKMLPHGNQPTWKEQEKLFVLKVVFVAAFGIGNCAFPKIDNSTDRDAASALLDFNPNKTFFFRNMKRDVIGSIYEEQVINTLTKEGICDENSKVSVFFDNDRSERVYVTFEDDENKNYEHIPKEIYRAIKFRHLKKGINLYVMNAKSSFDHAKKENALEYINGEYRQKKPFLQNPELCPLPTSFMSEMIGEVTHVINIQKFFFRPSIGKGLKLPKDDDRYLLKFREINKIINFSEIKSIIDLNRKLKEGDFVVVDCEESGFILRGKFIKLQSELCANIHLIDIGRTVLIDLIHVYDYVDKESQIKKDLFKIPPRIFECRLQGIQPAFLRYFSNEWTNEGIKLFSKAIMNQQVRIEIFSILNDVVNVKLFTTDENEEEICWNDKLIVDGYALACDESYMSIFENQNRIRRAKGINVYGPEEEFREKIDTSVKAKIRAPRNYACDIRVSLNGPINTLEVMLHGIAYHQRGLISIDPNSINHILLNNTANNMMGRFVVASEIYFQNHVKPAIKFRETTLMPSIVGLPVLLALIFSPITQIRRSKEKNRYESIITGLGADKNNVSHYLDRDCVLDIDFDLSDHDIAAINNLRLSMSYMMHMDPINEGLINLNDGQREKTLRKIQKQFMSIINKPRSLQWTITNGKDYHWNVDQENLQFQKSNQTVFNKIQCPKLEEMDAEKKAALLQTVEEMDKLKMSSSVPDDRKCKLCDEYLNSVVDMKVHFTSLMHNMNRKYVLQINNKL